MAGNKNSGRKPKQKQSTVNGTSPTRAKSSRLQSRKGKVPTPASSTTGKKTQTKIDKYVKKVPPAPLATRGSPKKPKSQVEPITSKTSSPKKLKENEGGNQNGKEGESKQFKCPYCNQGFSRKYDMEKHSRKVIISQSTTYINE